MNPSMSGFGSAYIGERSTPSAPSDPIQDLVRVNVDAAVQSFGLGVGAEVHPYTVTIVPQITSVSPAVSGNNGMHQLSSIYRTETRTCSSVWLIGCHWCTLARCVPKAERMLLVCLLHETDSSLPTHFLAATFIFLSSRSLSLALSVRQQSSSVAHVAWCGVTRRWQLNHHHRHGVLYV